MKRLGIVAGVVVLVGIGVWALRGSRSDLASMAKPAVAVFNTAVDSTAAVIGKALGAPPAEAPSPSPAPAPKPPTSVPRASKPTISARRPVVEPEGRTVEAASVPSEPALTVPSDVVDPVRTTDLAIEPLEPYNSNDADVVAPKLMYPQTLTVLPMGFHEDAVIAIEIVVNEAGRVDEVKAAVQPRTLNEYTVMLNGLSAAKTWRFHPATRHGAAVKYRLLIALDR